MTPGKEVCACGYPLVLANPLTTTLDFKGRRPLEPYGPDPAPTSGTPPEPVEEEPLPLAVSERPVVCDRCGEPNEADRTWCSRCANRLAAPEPEAGPRQMPAGGEDLPVRRQRHPLVWLVAGLVLAGVIGWVAGLVTGDEPSSAAPTPLAVMEVTASSTAPPSMDADGQEVTFDASRVVDGDPSTAWRAPGTSGHELVLRLHEPHEITEVALVPGYAKDDPADGTDRFAENHTVTQVRWDFGTGPPVVQDIAEPTREWARLVLPTPVTTSTVTLRVTGTGNPEAPRDFTAISEVQVAGR